MEEKEMSGEDVPKTVHSAHPVEPAEGAREPGEGADELRPPHPEQPAEGERETSTDGSGGAAS